MDDGAEELRVLAPSVASGRQARCVEFIRDEYEVEVAASILEPGICVEINTELLLAVSPDAPLRAYEDATLLTGDDSEIHPSRLLLPRWRPES